MLGAFGDFLFGFLRLLNLHAIFQQTPPKLPQMINPKQKQELFLFPSPSDPTSAAVGPHPASASCQPTSDIAAALGPTVKCSPQVEGASAQRLHTSHCRLRQSKDNGCKLRAGTTLFHPVGQGVWEEVTAQQVPAGKHMALLRCRRLLLGLGSAWRRAWEQLEHCACRKSHLAPPGTASSCLPGHCLVSSMGWPCSAPSPWGGGGPSCPDAAHPGAAQPRTATRTRRFLRQGFPTTPPQPYLCSAYLPSRKDMNKGGFGFPCSC